MIVMKEVTVWDMDYQPNHTYLFDGMKAVAYIKKGEKNPIYFSNPMTIDRRGRKFVELKTNPFKKKIESNLIKIVGSKGNVYHVDPEAKSCTCTGFQFRGKCKHIEQALAA
jgi:SWIM zinc finger